MDKKKAEHYWVLAAMFGHVSARYNLGAFEQHNGNMERALKHWMIAGGSGHDKSLEEIKELFKDGYATKNEYAKALRAHQSYLDEIKSHQRDEAAAYSDDFKYY